MEQLFDTFGIDWKLLVAQAVNFGILLVVLRYVLYKPIMKTLDERRAKIEQGVKDAEEASVKLAEADTEAGTRIAAADTEAEALVANARDAASSEKARIVKEAEERAARLTADAEARAEEAKAKALRESEQEIARLAILAAEKAMRKS